MGIFGQLNYLNIFSISLIALFLFVRLIIKKFPSNKKIASFIKDKQNFAVLICLLSFSVVNLVGALGPETAFDATWYHLTIPKLFAEKGSVYFIEGNLFYYSLMPKLTEMLYLSSLVLSNEILAKLIHFLFGILTTIVTYKISRLYLNKIYSLLAALIFYSNLVVAWLSITAFADLSRAFYESLSLLSFLIYAKNRKLVYLILGSILFGFALSTKLLALLSVPIFVLLILLIISFVTASPWYIFSYIHTKNPIFPVFSKLQAENFDLSLFNPGLFATNLAKFFIISSDPVSPIYLIMLPLLLMGLRNTFRKYRELSLYVAFSLSVLAVTPHSGGGRFIVQFLPAYSVLVSLLIFNLKAEVVKKLIIFTVLFIFLLNVSYRVLANAKYIDVIFGNTTKEKFLMENLNFSFGDFYDEGGNIKKIVGDNLVLVMGIHNLYYIDFNYTLDEWNNRNSDVIFILIQGGVLPNNYRHSVFVYENKKTDVKLYRIK